jgi:hypothetical protein
MIKTTTCCGIVNLTKNKHIIIYKYLYFFKISKLNYGKIQKSHLTYDSIIKQLYFWLQQTCDVIMMTYHMDDITNKTCSKWGLNPHLFIHNPKPLSSNHHFMW